MLNDPTKTSPIVKSREFRILAFKINEIKCNDNYLSILLYTHNNDEPPIVFNLSSPERVKAFKEYYGK